MYLPVPGIEPGSSVLQANVLPTRPQWQCTHLSPNLGSHAVWTDPGFPGRRVPKILESYNMARPVLLYNEKIVRISSL